MKPHLPKILFIRFLLSAAEIILAVPSMKGLPENAEKSSLKN
jgi:hypothetical protein